jgi:hypothetical protein
MGFEVLCPGIVILFGHYDEAVLQIFKLNHPIIIMQESNGAGVATHFVIPGSSLCEAPE